MKLQISAPSAAIALDKKSIKKSLRLAAQEVAALARSKIRSTAAHGLQHGSHVASAPGQPPSSLSGALAKATKVKTGSGLSFKITDTVLNKSGLPYGKFLETGSVGGGRKGNNKRRWKTTYVDGKRRRTSELVQASSSRVVAPRPYISLALDERRDSLQKRLEAAISKGVHFVKQKP